MKTIRTKQEYLGTVVLPNPEFGDIKLNVFPFTHSVEWIELPKQFKEYEKALNHIMNKIPLQEGANKHYVTIDSKFFTVKESLRREGVHIDGNFCADPDFKTATWGGTSTTWGGTSVSPQLIVTTKWVSEHKLVIPIGKYVSSDLGGLLVVSNEVGCKIWGGEFTGTVGNEGDFYNMKSQLKKENEYVLGKNELWLMSSNTPHDSLLIGKGKRRTFLRVTLAHNYNNSLLFKLNKAV